jgi:hypothetical protein
VSESRYGFGPTEERVVTAKGGRAAAAFVACLFGGLACSTNGGSFSKSGEPKPDLLAAATTAGTLPSGVIARVGSFDVLSERVARVAEAQHVSAKAACDAEVRDALFASGALARNLADTPDVAAALRGRLARTTLSLLAHEAASQEPTDDEVAAATARHFVDLDRPESFRVIHAVVIVAAGADGATKGRARDVAERIRRAVAHVKDPSEFRSRVEAVDRSGLDVKVEELRPVAADGRIVDPENPPVPGGEPGGYVPRFAAAAARLAQPGDQSDVVETEYGWHVLMLIERRPAHTVPLEERRRILRDEIIAWRAKRSVEALRTDLRNKHKPVIERSADALLAGVSAPTQ